MSEAIDGEIHAMAAVAKALDSVKDDTAALKRVLHWAIERYGSGTTVRLNPGGPGSSKQGSAGRASPAEDAGRANGSDYADVAELFDAARPKTDWAKAVVVGHWLMIGEGKADFASQEVNAALKHLGHGVTNITDALNKAIRQKPALVIQTEKSGKAKQARKKYKITRAGALAVEKMIAGDDPSGEKE